MNKQDCFKFTNWVITYYKRLDDDMYLPRLSRYTGDNAKTLPELYDQWKKQQAVINAHK